MGDAAGVEGSGRGGGHGGDGGRAGMARRGFLGAMAALGLPAAGLPVTGLSVIGLPLDGPPRAGADFPRNDMARVQAVVGSSHGNFERVRELVLEQPALAKASWDWGFGDWETALGAASHTGRREIALFLIEHGARPTIFSAAMLGDMRTVEAFLDADPELIRLHGPHGISLVRHARAGGEEARGVLDYLLDRFGPDDAPVGFPGDTAAEARYGGAYAFEAEPPFRIVVGVRNDLLLIGTGEQPTSRVLAVEGDVFHPTGAPAVRLRFDVSEGRAVTLEIQDGPIRVVGRRVEG